MRRRPRPRSSAPIRGLSARSAALFSIAAATRAAAAGWRSASQAWMAATSASAFRAKADLSHGGGRLELPDARGPGSNGSSWRRFSSASSASVKAWRSGVGRDVGRDQVGEPVLRVCGERGAGFVEDRVETGVHGERIAGWQGASKGRARWELVPAAVVDRLLAGESPVRVWREHRGLTQSGLARASGVNRVVVADIEAGRKGGSVRSLKALAGGAWGGDRRSGLSGVPGGPFEARRCGSHFADLAVDKSARACLPLAGAIPRQPGRRARIGAVRASLAPLGLRRGGGQRTGQLSPLESCLFGSGKGSFRSLSVNRRGNI